MVVSCSALHATSWLEAAGAVAAENQALRLLADLAGLPAGAGGCFVSGGSLGNLSALVVARDTAAARGVGTPQGRPLVAVSEEAHSSIAGALTFIGADAFLVPSVDHRLTGGAWPQPWQPGPGPSTSWPSWPPAGPPTPASSTTSPGGRGRTRAQPLVPRRRRVRRRGPVCALGAGRFDGIEQADSFIVDPHKWLYAPFDSCALLYREPALAKASTARKRLPRRLEGRGVEPSDYAIHLSRRPRGMPLWFSLAVYGTNAYAEASSVDHHGCCVRRVHRDRPLLELVRRPELSIVASGDATGPSRLQRLVHRSARRPARLRDPDHLGGHPAARLAILHPDTDMAMLEASSPPWPELRSAGRRPSSRGSPGWRMASPPRGASARRCPRVPRAPRGSPERP